MIDLRHTARQCDQDRYLASLFAPSDLQPALWALIILNSEIARTREMVTETQLGLIRLQWWRERLEKICNGKACHDHAVLSFFSNHKNFKLNKDDIDHLIYAREFDLEDVLPATLDGTILYTSSTHAPLLKLFSNILGVDEDINDVATGFSLIGLLRAVPFHAQQRRCYLPQDLIEKNNIDLEKFYAGKASGVEKVTEVILNAAREKLLHLTPRHPMFRALKSIACIYADRIKTIQCNVFDPKLNAVIPFKELRVAWRVYKGQ